MMSRMLPTVFCPAARWSPLPGVPDPGRPSCARLLLCTEPPPFFIVSPESPRGHPVDHVAIRMTLGLQDRADLLQRALGPAVVRAHEEDHRVHEPKRVAQHELLELAVVPYPSGKSIRTSA